MEKLVFKNVYLNAVFGGLLIALAILGYFLGFFADYLPIFTGAILILLSLKRFIYSFKKITSKYATLILIIELAVDIVFGGLLIYLADHVALFIGLIIYIRGVAYLLINYIATRKINLLQYVMNIGYLTIGAFLMFTGSDLDTALVIGFSALILIVGGIYFLSGLTDILEKSKQKKSKKKENEPQGQKQKNEQTEETKIGEQKEKINELEQKVKEAEKKSKTVEKEKKDLQKKVTATFKESQKSTVDNFDSKTVVELKALAKEKNLQGYSQLNKSELITFLRKHK